MKILPETVDGLLDEMARRFPEPRYDPNMTAAEVRHMLSRRSAYLELRDAYAAARKRA